MKHKKLFVAVIAIILVLSLTLLASGQSLMQHMGKEDRQSEEDGEMTVIAYIQGEEFTVNTGYLETTYSYYQQTLEPKDEDRVKEFFVAHELLYRESQAQGLNASPEEVDEYIAFLREDQHNTPEAYAALCEIGRAHV